MLPSSRLLAAARYLADVTQKELADKADIAVSSLRRVELGASGVKAVTVEKVMEALASYDIEFVLDRKGNREGLMHAVPTRTPGRSSGSAIDDGKLRRIGGVGKSKRAKDAG